MIGIVYYLDDPEKKVFRKVFLSPGDTENVLDNAEWVTVGVDPNRTAVLEKIADDDPRAVGDMNGLP